MALVDLITEDVVKVPLVSENKHDIIRELIKILVDAGRINDGDAAYNAIIRREEQGSTGLEKGIAVPHAKCGEVSTLTMAIGIKPSGVDFEAIDEKPSYLFFMLLAPPDQSGPHIEALAEIARMARSDAFCSTLIASRSAKEVVDLFKEE
ncbi:MAG: PTS sugar transporter subunit IIA [Spirochaetales bacterium]|nr:PTS sugar transporter subunit IIA [Spirochaetales bacterium]